MKKTEETCLQIFWNELYYINKNSDERQRQWLVKCSSNLNI